MNDKKIRTIVAGVGPAFWEDPVLPAALDLARGCNAELHVVRAFDPSTGDRDASSDDRVARRRQDMLDGLCGQIESLGGSSDVGCHVMIGPPDEVVARLAHDRDADLVCIGAARKENLALRLLGTKAERIISRSKRPVLVFRRAVDRPVRKILLALSAAPESEGILARGWGTADALFGEDDPRYRCLRAIWEPPTAVASEAHAEISEASAALDELIAQLGVAQAESRVRAGLPAGEILAEAREWPADLVVMGTNARSGAERMLMGSVSASVLRDLPGNALVVPART